ncbi:Potassium voltage-gated channel subfamily G member 3 [Larimichthys crocea]|uniref:Potassium voltage-gated channel subfamily G member 3 n=1 Tax=Larimichthys crocea TaxID=215358 RepID=A0A6G0HNW3_LARCR|nr:Potassium voltage-gated channel subfamily G member 3 [Larimichthys crocea]
MPFMPVKFNLQKRVKLAQGLWMIYWVSVILGILIFSLGIFFKIELRKRSEMMDNNESHLVPNLLILVGMLACGVNAFGGKVCHDSLDPIKFAKWKPMLKTYLLLCCGFNALLLLTVVLCFIMQFAVYLTLAEGLKNSIKFYKDTDTPGRCFMKRTLDMTQIEFRCCGNNNFRDWFEVQWISNRYLDMSNDAVKDGWTFVKGGQWRINEGFKEHHLTNNSAHYDYDHRIEELNIWTRGCREALFSYFSGMMNSIGILIITTIILESVDMAGLKYLCTALETMEDPENPECESEGWLLEKGVKETFSELLSKLKALGKTNQVDEGGDAQEEVEEVEEEEPLLLFSFRLNNDKKQSRKEEPRAPEEPQSPWLERMRRTFEEPASSLAAQILASVSVLFVVISMVMLCASTLPDWMTAETTDQHRIIEAVCIGWFTAECIVRFLVSRDKCEFVCRPLNVIDLLAITPYYISVTVTTLTGENSQLQRAGVTLRVLRIMRIFWVIKLARHFLGLQTLGLTLRRCYREMMMLLVFIFVAMAIFSALAQLLEHGLDLESGNQDYASIPAASWWVIISMTTVGYGDMYPVTVAGRVLGGLCVVSGIVLLALPITFIYHSFIQCYHELRVRSARGMPSLSAEFIH